MSTAAAPATDPIARRALRIPLTAVMFLTRIRVPSWVTHAPDDLARSTIWFPAVGALVGSIAVAVAVPMAFYWEPIVAAVVAVGVTVRITGAFHEDALADACDGFGGGWTTEQVLAIMRDSRIGSYGAIGLLLVTLLRVVCLGILATHSIPLFAAALVAGHTLGRWSSLPLIRWLAYVREGEGKSKPFAASVTTARLVAGSVMTLAVIGALFGLGPATMVLPLLAIGVTTWLGRYFHRRIGGMTGDCLGAANQAVEAATYLALAMQHLRAAGVAPWWP